MNPDLATALGQRRMAVALVVLFTGINLAYVLLWLPPGHFSIDEGIYHLMARSMLDGHGWLAANGYAEFPYPPFTMRFLVPSGEMLAPQYPPLLPLIGAPFLAALGFRGLLLVSVLSHTLAVVLACRIGTRLFGDARLALGAATLYGVGTYALGYSQSAFAQTLTATCLLAAVWMLVRRDSPALRDFVLAGFWIGLGGLARLDAFLAAAGIVWWLLWSRPLIHTWRPGLGLAAGLAPALAALAAINAVKFGNWNPFSYGSQGGNTDPTAHLPLLLALAAAGAAFLATRSRRYVQLPRRVRMAVLLTGGLLAAGLLHAYAPQVLPRFARGVLALLVDMRFYLVSANEFWLDTGDGGAIRYDGVYKKALFQSLPLLAVGLLFGLQAAKRDPVTGQPRLLLWTVAVTMMAPYLILSWHGGLAFNQRYFLPVLAALLLLSLAVLRDAARGSLPGGSLAAGASYAAILYLAARSVTLPGLPAPDELALPLVLAAALGLAVAVSMRRDGASGNTMRLLLGFVAGAAVAWGVVTSLGDMGDSHRRRATNADIGGWSLGVFPKRSVIVAGYPDPYFGNVDHGVLFANPEIDDYASMNAIIERADALGYSLYFMLNESGWKTLAARGVLAGRVVCSNVFPGRPGVRQIVRGRCPGG